MTASPDAAAQTEIGLGLAASNYTGGASEHGASLQVMIAGDRFDDLPWAGSPRPYALASLNLAGHTNYVAAGAEWRFALSEHWNLEPGLGLALHDGVVHNPYPRDDPQAPQYARSHRVLGARVLFRWSLSARRQLGSGDAVVLTIEHLSNGGRLLGHDENQSLNALSVSWIALLR